MDEFSKDDKDAEDAASTRIRGMLHHPGGQEAIQQTKDLLHYMQLVFDEFFRSGEWPELPVLQREVARRGDLLDLRVLSRELPIELGTDPGRTGGKAMLSIIGASFCRGSEELVHQFLSVMGLAFERYKGDGEPTFTVDDVATVLGVNADALSLRQLRLLLDMEPFFLVNEQEGRWWATVSDNIIYVGAPATLEQFIEGRGRLTSVATRPTYFSSVADQQGAAPTSDADRAVVVAPAVLWDFFICHASEDKTAIATPLAEAFVQAGLTVWYDENEIGWGDSLRRKIDEGLAACRFGIVILSPSFFATQWAQAELDALFSLMTAERVRLLPLWHEVDSAFIQERAPLLAGIRALHSSVGADRIVLEAQKLLDRVAPTAADSPTAAADLGTSAVSPASGDEIAFLKNLYRIINDLTLRYTDAYQTNQDPPSLVREHFDLLEEAQHLCPAAVVGSIEDFHHRARLFEAASGDDGRRRTASDRYDAFMDASKSARRGITARIREARALDPLE